MARRLLVALASVLVTACGATAGQAPAAPADEGHVDLRLGYFANLTHASALVGLQRGIFAQSLGSNVTLTTAVVNAGPDAVTALLSNSLDASFVGPNPAINAYVQSHGQAIRVVSGATSGGAALVVRPSINSPSDLKGKTIASPQLGNTQDVALRYWLQQKGFKTNPDGSGDVAVHPEDNSTTLTAFKSGQIDGAWVPEPYATRLVAEDGGKVLVDERDLWTGTGGKFATTVLVVRTDFLKQHPTTVKHLVEAQEAASDFINSQPAAAQQAANTQLGVISKKLPDAEVATAWAHMTFTVDPVATSIQQSAAHAQDVGFPSSGNLKGLFDLSVLNAVLTEKGKPAVKGL